jgi:hypothetical protein
MLGPFLVPSPKFQSNVSFYQILAAFIVGLILQPCVRSVRVCLRYKGVWGRYSVLREYSDGRTDLETGEIRIRLNWWLGSFAVTAFHATRKVQWRGEMHLSLDMKNVGNGVFWHVDEAEGVGDQKFRYIPEKKQFRVHGVTFAAGEPAPFFHLWTRK